MGTTDAILWPRSDENGVFMGGCLDVQIPCIIDRLRVLVRRRVPNLVNKSQTIQRLELKSRSVVTAFEGLYLSTVGTFFFGCMSRSLQNEGP